MIVDYRAPDTIRLGVAPLYLDRGHVDAAMTTLADVVRTRAYERYEPQRRGVT